MVNNSFYKCGVCGDIIRFRYQVGFSNILVNVYCPVCNSHIFGEIVIDNKNFTISENIKNAAKIEDPDENANHVIELSSEFLSKKCQVDKGLMVNPMSMFMRSNPFDQARTDRRNSLTFLINNLDEYVRTIDNVFNLIKRGNVTLLKEYLSKLNTRTIQKDKLQEDSNYLDVLIASKHFLNVALRPSMSSGVFEKMYNIMNNIVPLFVKKHLISLKEFLDYLFKNNYFEFLLTRIPKFLIEYLKRIGQLAPIYDVYSDFDTINKEEDGVSTISISDMVVIYKNGYELICDSIDLIVGLYNIDNKGTYDNFDEGLANFDEKMNSFSSKYLKYEHFAKDSSVLFDGISNKLNNIIRNAEGHNSIVVDGLNQQIQFVSKNKRNTKTINLSFVEFGKQCMDLYFAVLYIWEFYYQLFKLKLVVIDKMQLHYFPDVK